VAPCGATVVIVLPDMSCPAAWPPGCAVTFTLPTDNPLTNQATMPKAPIPNAPSASRRNVGARSATGKAEVRSMIGRTSSTIMPMAIPAMPAILPSDPSDERSMTRSPCQRSKSLADAHHGIRA
jgi:hypothetical protein